MVRLGQHLPGGEGAMEPSLHLSTRHLTAPQSSTWHWLEEGQHSPRAMGARDPSEQNSGIQALASQSAIGQREGSGQQSPAGLVSGEGRSTMDAFLFFHSRNFPLIY